MKRKKKDLAEIAESMQGRCDDIKTCTKEMLKMMRLVRQNDKTMKELEEYYSGDWMNDREIAFERKDMDFGIYGEDEIYNSLAEYSTAKIRMMKAMSESLLDERR